MKLKKLLEINQMCEERKAPWDVQESYTYNSKTSGKTDILNMDIIHFVRAFKLLNKQYNPKVEGSLHWISDRLTSLSKELKEYTESGD